MTYYLVISDIEPLICLCTEHTWSRWSSDIFDAFKAFKENPHTTYCSASNGTQPFNTLFRLIKSRPNTYTIYKLELPDLSFDHFKQLYPELLL